MITESQKIEYEIEQLEAKSRSLKAKHEWGQWDNWRKFTNLDVTINKHKIRLLELKNELLNSSLDTYKDY